MDLNHASMKLFDAEPGKLYCNNIQYEYVFQYVFFKKTYVSEPSRSKGSRTSFCSKCDRCLKDLTDFSSSPKPTKLNSR